MTRSARSAFAGVLDLVDRYHATADALDECGRLVRTLEIQRYLGDYALCQRQPYACKMQHLAYKITWNLPI